MRTDGPAARLIAIVLTGALASGCTAARVVTPGPGGLHESIQPGDTLRLTLVDGRRLELKVMSVSRTELVGVAAGRERTPEIVPLADVALAERMEFSAGKTVLIGAGVVTAMAALVLVFIINFMTAIGGGASPAGPGPGGPAALPTPGR